jgi:hypothetical protein
MRFPKTRHATVVAYLALFAAMTGTAAAATGGTFLIGRSNAATSVTALSNSTGTPLALGGKSGYAPLTVTSTIKVSRLNSDLLDGLDSAALQRRVAGTCPSGSWISAISASGTVSCSSPSGSSSSSAISGVDGSRLYIVGTTIVGNGSNASGYGLARCANIGDVLLSGGFKQPFQAQAKVQGSFPENYVMVTANHTAGWITQYQQLPNAETLDTYAICQHAV